MEFNCTFQGRFFHLTADLIRASGVSRDLVYKYIDGKVDNPRGDALEKIAAAIGMSVAELRFGATAPISARRIPLLTMNKIGTISELSGVSSAWDGVSTVFASGVSKEAFAVTLEDSACGPDFPAGSVVIVDPTSPPAPGRYVVALVPKIGAVMRRYRQRGSSNAEYWLVADNPDFPDIHVTCAQDAIILGRAVQHIREI
jgi:SOS-response transcriptional repressor LexA